MRAHAALFALVMVAGAHAYTIDCNHEYTDCDTELGKLTGEEDETAAPSQTVTTVEKIKETPQPLPRTTTTATPTRSTTPTTTEPEVNTEEDIISTTDATGQKSRERARLLNLSEDDLKNFAITLHNQTESDKKFTDLSDVNLEGDEEFDLSKIAFPKSNKDLPPKFYSNLQAPFHPMVTTDHSDEGKEEGDATCVENGVNYKVGEQVNRSCEETCTCQTGGTFSCSPRCKHPYIRRGRHLTDPLCFESPVDECCSIIACATGNGDLNVSKLEICKYGNDTYFVGNTWNVGCDQRCSCEKNSVVTCKPRCPPLPQSDKCINVQDPNDACCEVQVCDVSQDVHEDQTDNSTNSTTSEKPGPTEHPEISSTMRPLVLTEPIGSIKVLQNNTVQVTLMHSNSSQDPVHLLISDDGGVTYRDAELKYDNLILNLDGGKDYILKTKETGTKFNFTITAMDLGKKESTEELIEVNEKIGCHHDGKFYEVGSEFHIGCTELCECTGDETRECAALECPSHVGLELVSKGCVRWAPSPPPAPPNCCPRAARCLSDGTCHYNGVPIPNWTDVPISLSGCEQRCFCENGELDCQEVCSPLPPLPPQSLRCPPAHRPAPVNISDDDCCKHWGCVPNGNKIAGKGDLIQSDTTPMYEDPHFTVPLPPRKTILTDNDFYRHNSAHIKPKFLPTVPPLKQYIVEPEDYESNENLTSFNFGHLNVPYDSEEPTSEFRNHSISEGKNQPPSDHSYSYVPLQPPALLKHPNYKFTHNSVPDVVLPASPHKDPPQKQTTKSQNIPKFHQPVYFMPASKKANPTLSQNVVEPKVYDIPNVHFKSVNNFSVHNPERFEIPIPTSKPPLKGETKDKVHGRYMTALHTPTKPTQLTDKNRWDQNTKLHILTKSPNPYENVLLRAVPGMHTEPSFLYNHAAPTKAYSALDLENLLSQMEVESEANRNLERSADRSRLTAAGQLPTDVPSSTQPQIPKAPFLPTVPPDSGSFHFPQDEDYHDNDIHRPTNPLVPGIPGLPPGITVPPNNGENKKLTVITLMSDSPTSVKMLFGLPPVLVGLRGSVDLRYTDKADEEIQHWYSQVFAPADEILTTSRLEFRLTGLKPSTVYKMRGKLYLHNLPVEPESDIYSIRTQDLPTLQVGPVEVKRRVVDSSLKVHEINDTVAQVSWRRFTEDDLQFIDAIQVRYRPVGNPIYSMTELLHHSRDSVLLHDLRPGSRYEASLVLVPPPRATTELHDPAAIEFNTAPFVDPYNWSVQLEARSVGSTAAELTWKGVPAPAERWVRVYRAAHACQTARREHDAFRLPGADPAITLQGLEPDSMYRLGMGNYHAHDSFRLATRDQPPAITLSGLEPDTLCRVWLELFLSNGKVKTSNVLEIKTKAIDSPEPIDNAIEASSVGGSRTAPRGDYYGALVVVGVVAALGALTSLLLLLVVVRRHRPRSVPITPVPTAPRESSLPPYDNPAYKLELQQETMDL